MDILLSAVSSLLTALFLYYILNLIFGNTSGKVAFFIFLFISVGRVVLEVATNDILVNTLPTVIKGFCCALFHGYFLFLLIKRYQIFSFSFRSQKFKRNYKKPENITIKSVSDRLKRITYLLFIVSLILFSGLLIIKILKLFADIHVLVVIFSGLLSVLLSAYIVLIKYHKDQIVLIVGKTNKKCYALEFNNSLKQEMIFTDERYFFDYAGRGFLKEGFTTSIYHVFILENDIKDLELKKFTSFDFLNLTDLLITDFKRYSEKTVSYRLKDSVVERINK